MSFLPPGTRLRFAPSIDRPMQAGRRWRFSMTALSNVILVHGAWADGSSWAKVIPLLTQKGLSATAVQLPLTGFEADVAAVQRAIALAEGEVVLVGHSYAGAVIGAALFVLAENYLQALIGRISAGAADLLFTAFGFRISRLLRFCALAMSENSRLGV